MLVPMSKCRLPTSNVVEGSQQSREVGVVLFGSHLAVLTFDSRRMEGIQWSQEVRVVLFGSHSTVSTSNSIRTEGS